MMSLDQKDYIDVSRRAMNLLTKKGFWKAAPINPKTPREVTYSFGNFRILGEQLGREVKFDIIYEGNTCAQGYAQINWLTEDSSFKFLKVEISEKILEELRDIYSSELPESVII